METREVESILSEIHERRSFRPEELAQDLDHLPRREATDLTPEELAEISVADWVPES